MNPVQFRSTGSITLPAAVQLNPGRVLTVRVNSIFSDGRLRISLDGSFLIADRTKNLPDLAAGSEIRAVVRGSDSDGRVVLELVPDAESGLLRRLDFPDTAEYRAVTEAFARTGLALDPAAIEAVSKRLRVGREDLSLAARLLALLRHKGLPDNIDSRLLLLVTPGTSEEDRGDERQGKRERQSYEQPDRHGSGKSNKVTTEARSDAATREKLVTAVYDYLGREPESVHELHLFNHYNKASPHRTIVPLRIDPFDRVTLALRVNSDGRTEMATLRISWDRVRFQAHWVAASSTLRVATNSSMLADLGNGNIHQLRERLQTVGVHVDSISVSLSLDGFSDEEIEKILRPFDRNV